MRCQLSANKETKLRRKGPSICFSKHSEHIKANIGVTESQGQLTYDVQKSGRMPRQARTFQAFDVYFSNRRHKQLCKFRAGSPSYLMEEERRTFPNLVELNVGGVFYTTRLSTLLQHERSMLAAMFSGRYEVLEDSFTE